MHYSPNLNREHLQYKLLVDVGFVNNNKINITLCCCTVMISQNNTVKFSSLGENLAKKSTTAMWSPETAVSNAFVAVSLDKVTKTDPKIMCELYREMHLGGIRTNYLPLQWVLQKAITEPIDIRMFVGQIKQGLSKNEIVSDFLEEACYAGYLQPHELYVKALHFAFLIEQLTFLQANSLIAANDIQKFFYEERKKKGVDTMHPLAAVAATARLTRSPFKTAKFISIIPFIKKIALERENGGPLSLEKISVIGKLGFTSSIEQLYLTPHETMKHPMIQLNILEAGNEEYLRGFKDNAFVAFALQKGCQIEETIEYKVGAVVPNSCESQMLINPFEINMHPEYHFSKEWVDLYESWNMCFILSDMHDLHLILPKLFIPSQIDAKPHDYIFTRALSLDCVINFYLFRLFDKVPHVESPAKCSEIAKLWGAINKQHCNRYIINELHTDLKEFERGFKAYYTKGICNFAVMAKDFATK